MYGGGCKGPQRRAIAVILPHNIHIASCETDAVLETLSILRESPKTKKFRAKFLLATDGKTLEAEDLATGDVLSCNWENLSHHFSFFLPLAGISTVQAIRDNPIDINATLRLNRLYLELQKTNPAWDSNDPNLNMNRFMAQLIFCFFAEDTGIFYGDDLFTRTVEDVSTADNAHEAISTLFRTMATPIEDRVGKLASTWANRFKYVNGGLFSESVQVPTFSKSARSYLLHAGNLDWRSINPDIFGSMTQAIADNEERGQLGLHYTSIPNILKVLNPLFLNELREKLKDSWDSPQKLLNLRRLLSRIRIFDPACGSGNFLVVAYKQLREIEHEIVEQRIKLLGEQARRHENTRSVIPLTNFFGIEIKEFACEIAQLSMLIAEYQCDVLYLGQQIAADAVLPLHDNKNIHRGNALHFDWDEVCPHSDDEKVPTYICGNPPYKGSQTQTKSQKSDLVKAFNAYNISTRQLDYVAGWFIKASEYIQNTHATFAFVSTNSISQGRIVPILWPVILSLGLKIEFAYKSFRWSNLAARNAGVTVVIIGIGVQGKNPRIFEPGESGISISRQVKEINPYLTSAPIVFVKGRNENLSDLSPMAFGNMPLDGGNLLMSDQELELLNLDENIKPLLTRNIVGSKEYIRGESRYCLWIENKNLDTALSFPEVRKRIEAVKNFRNRSKAPSTVEFSKKPHQFTVMNHGKTHSIVVPGVSSEHREYIPAGVLNSNSVISNAAFGMYDVPIWNFSIIVSRLHLLWVKNVCGKLESRIRYSNTIGWNTFPVPTLSTENKLILGKCAKAILHAREQYFPATIAEMYDPERLDTDFPLVREAHQANCETLERIYSTTPFRNDTERLEKLFDLYAEMTSKEQNS